MATRIVRPRSGFIRGGSRRKQSVWTGVHSTTPTSVASDTPIVIEVASSAVILAFGGAEGHIARTRGRIIATAATGAQDPALIWGVGVFDEGLTTATAFPQPDDETLEPYFAWGMCFGQTDIALATRPGSVMDIDSKAKRRYGDTDRIILMLKGVASGHTLSVQFQVICLLIKDQGR